MSWLRDRLVDAVEIVGGIPGYLFTVTVWTAFRNAAANQ